jgi:hypothetical protein
LADQDPRACKKEIKKEKSNTPLCYVLQVGFERKKTKEIQERNALLKSFRTFHSAVSRLHFIGDEGGLASTWFKPPSRRQLAFNQDA